MIKRIIYLLLTAQRSSFSLLLVCSMLLFAFAAQTQTIPPPYINYQAILYDVNGPNPNAPYALQSFPAYVNLNDELGNLLYREEHYSSTDANGQVTIKIGDGLYLAGPITNFNQINWASGKYYLVVEFDINGTISATAPEQLVTVPYSFYSGNSGSGIASIADNGNGSLTFTYNNGTTYTTPVLNGLTGPAGPAGVNGAQGPQGVQGPTGIAGTNGLNALINTMNEPAGSNCANGGTKIETGLDANGNGTLEAGEINASQTKYVCNGEDGLFPGGSITGQINYWNGSSWVVLNPGLNGQSLTICNGILQWGPCQLSIGDIYGGGVIGYLLQPGDEGYHPLIQHGLIISNDLGPNVYLPGGSFGPAPSAVRNLPDCMGCGYENTSIFISNLGSLTTYAALTAYNLIQSGYTDWYLPCYSELSAVFQNISHPNISSILNLGSAFWTCNVDLGGNFAAACDNSGCYGTSFNWTNRRVIAFRRF